MKKIPALLFVLAVSSSAVSAQTPLAAIHSVISDLSGAAILNAKVTATPVSHDTGFQWTARTAIDGSYHFAALAPVEK